MAQINHADQLKKVLKILMKKRGITYEDISIELNCSLPTVKRIMTTEELSVTRLFSICNLLKVNLAELEAFAENVKEDNLFTETQDTFLADHPQYLAFLLDLHDGKSPDRIQTEYGLSEKTKLKYLKQLEKLELLTVNKKGAAKLKHRSFPSFSRKGRLARVWYRRIFNRASEFFVSNVEEMMNLREDEESKLRARNSGRLPTTIRCTVEVLNMHPDHITQYMEKLANLSKEISKASEADRLRYHDSELKKGVFFLCSGETSSENRYLQLVEKVFGVPT